MTITYPTRCRLPAVAALYMAAALSFAATAAEQPLMAPNQIGTQLLSGPNPADDPNFPGANGRVTVAAVGGDVTWTRRQGPVLDWHQAGDPDSAVNIPTVLLPKLEGKPAVWADYLGFIDGEGALLEAGVKGAVYLFNGSARTLTRKYDSLEQIPEATLAALKNRKYVYESSRDPLSVLPASQTDNGGPAPPAAAKRYEPDPNLAGTPQDDYPLAWDPSRTGYYVRLPQTQPVPAMYMGFNERGSWIASALGKLYLWNLAGKSLVEMGNDWWDAPLDLRNPSVLTQGMIYYRLHQYKAAAGPHQSPDPNFPPMLTQLSKALKASWEYQGNDMTRPPLVFVEVGAPDFYLGFDERGAWVQDHHFGVYAWNFRTWRLERVASRFDNVPHEAQARLHR